MNAIAQFCAYIGAAICVGMLASLAKDIVRLGYVKGSDGRPWSTRFTAAMMAFATILLLGLARGALA